MQDWKLCLTTEDGYWRRENDAPQGRKTLQYTYSPSGMTSVAENDARGFVVNPLTSSSHPFLPSFLPSLYRCISHSLKFHLKKQTRRTLISSLFYSSTRKSRSIKLYRSVEKSYWLDYGSKDWGIRFWFPVWAGNLSVPHSVNIAPGAYSSYY